MSVYDLVEKPRIPKLTSVCGPSSKENILFGLPLRPKRYQQVLDACSLTNDLRVLEDGVRRAVASEPSQGTG
jgi:hypothetical protein